MMGGAELMAVIRGGGSSDLTGACPMGTCAVAVAATANAVTTPKGQARSLTALAITPSRLRAPLYHCFRSVTWNIRPIGFAVSAENPPASSRSGGFWSKVL